VLLVSASYCINMGQDRDAQLATYFESEEFEHLVRYESTRLLTDEEQKVKEEKEKKNKAKL